MAVDDKEREAALQLKREKGKIKKYRQIEGGNATQSDLVGEKGSG